MPRMRRAVDRSSPRPPRRRRHDDDCHGPRRDGRARQLMPLVDARAGNRHTVRDYMSFIKEQGRRVRRRRPRCATRCRAKQPKDIDLATSMPAQDLIDALPASAQGPPPRRRSFQRSPPTSELVQIGRGTHQLDIACNKSPGRPTPGHDLNADARTRDFRMTRLYSASTRGRGSHPSSTTPPGTRGRRIGPISARATRPSSPARGRPPEAAANTGAAREVCDPRLRHRPGEPGIRSPGRRRDHQVARSRRQGAPVHRVHRRAPAADSSRR